MFQKTFRVKSNTAIRSSDRKKLRQDVTKQYPGLSDEAASSIIPNKEEMSVMKIYTHSGQSVIVYNLQKIPVFFEIDRVLYPTVYTLWKHPDMIPYFTTWPPVFSKLTAGADLMLPGVVVHGELTAATLGSLNKGQPCAVNLAGNRAAVAVGRTALSSSDMIDAGMRGKGVIILHTYQDQLWAHGDKAVLPDLEDSCRHDEVLQQAAGPEQFSETDSDANVSHQNGSAAQSSFPENMSCPAPADMAPADNSSDQPSPSSLLDNLSITDETSDTLGVNSSLSTEEMDDLIRTCFLCALKSDVKKSDLPILTSKFFKFLQAWCPADKHIDVKKSSFKKLSKFLKHMEDSGFIRTKALSAGVDSIVEIRRENKELASFQVPEKPETSTHQLEATNTEAQQPSIVEMYSVTAALSKLFQGFGNNKGCAMTKAEVRQLLTDYVNANELKDPENKGFVVLDPYLHDCVANKGEYITSLRWEHLTDRLIAKMGACYSISLHGGPPVVKKGKPNPILLKVVQRAGNKKVTLIDNLETFGIEPKDLAHLVQVGVSCSTSVTPLPGKGCGMQVSVQGNQTNYVGQLLQNKYKVPKKYIEGLQKPPKSAK